MGLCIYMCVCVRVSLWTILWSLEASVKEGSSTSSWPLVFLVRCVCVCVCVCVCCIFLAFFSAILRAFITALCCDLKFVVPTLEAGGGRGSLPSLPHPLHHPPPVFLKVRFNSAIVRRFVSHFLPKRIYFYWRFTAIQTLFTGLNAVQFKRPFIHFAASKRKLSLHFWIHSSTKKIQK